MFSLIPKEVRFYDYFEQQSKHILNAAALLHDLCHNFSTPAPRPTRSRKSSTRATRSRTRSSRS